MFYIFLFRGQQEYMYTYPHSLGYGHGCFTTAILRLFLLLSQKITVFTALSGKAVLTYSSCARWSSGRFLIECHDHILCTSKRMKRESTSASNIRLMQEPFMFTSMLALCFNYPAILFFHIPQIGCRLQAGACHGKKKKSTRSVILDRCHIWGSRTNGEGDL